MLLYKRLETDRFRLPPVDANAQSAHVDVTQLAMLLDGIDVAQNRPENRVADHSPTSQPHGYRPRSASPYSRPFRDRPRSL